MSHSTKLQKMMREAGFLPDGDLIEFAQMVLEESFKFLDPEQVQLLRKYFEL